MIHGMHFGRRLLFSCTSFFCDIARTWLNRVKRDSFIYRHFPRLFHLPVLRAYLVFQGSHYWSVQKAKHLFPLRTTFLSPLVCSFYFYLQEVECSVLCVFLSVYAVLNSVYLFFLSMSVFALVDKPRILKGKIPGFFTNSERLINSVLTHGTDCIYYLYNYLYLWIFKFRVSEFLFANSVISKSDWHSKKYAWSITYMSFVTNQWIRLLCENRVTCVS